MDENYRLPYEISIWDDVLTTECYSKEEIEGHQLSDKWSMVDATKYCEDNNLNFDETFNTIQYFDERMVAVIGSDTMDSPIRAMSPSLKRNVNGTVTLTFSIYLKYYDEETDEIKDNPFISLLVNERKLKVKYNNQWFDCIIKDVQEDSNEKTMTITTCDQHINELSKTGFNIEFNTDLSNNIGNITYFGEKIVDGTDWEINNDANTILIERYEEPLYKAVLKNSITATDLGADSSSSTVTIAAGKNIYIFYSSMTKYEDGESKQVQFLYKANESEQNPLSTDGNNMLVLDNWDDSKYQTSQYLSNDLSDDTFESYTISNRYRGNKLVKSSNVKYDPVTDRVVTVYGIKGTGQDEEYVPCNDVTADNYNNKVADGLYIMSEDNTGNTCYIQVYVSDPYSEEQIYYVCNPYKAPDEVYGYTETTYDVSNIVNNYVYNACLYPNTDGWSYGNYTNDIMRQIIYRESFQKNEDNTYSRVLKQPEASYIGSDKLHDTLNFVNGHWYLNSGFTQNFTKTTGFSKGDKYVFRVSAGRSTPKAKGNGYDKNPTQDSTRYPSGVPTSLGNRNVLQNTPQYFRAKIQDYKYDADGTIIWGTTYFNFSYAKNSCNPSHNYQASADYSGEGAYALYENKIGCGCYYYIDNNGKYNKLKTNTSGVSDTKKTTSDGQKIYTCSSTLGIIYEKKYVHDYKYATATCACPLSYSAMLSGVRTTKDGKKTSGWKVGLFVCAPSTYEKVKQDDKLYQSVQYYYYNGSSKSYEKIVVNNMDSYQPEGDIYKYALRDNKYWKDVDYYVEDIQVFEYQKDGDYFLQPGDPPSSSTYTKYFYYTPVEDLTKTAEDIEYLYQGFTPQSTYVEQSKEHPYEKVRTLVQKESNRYNLIQSLCELFECWARFDVERDEETGKISKEMLTDDDGAIIGSRLKKSVAFLPYIGEDNYAGFKYGINLNSIQRSLDSSAIVTKLIVKANANKHATNGFCTIQRAEDNPIKAEFILNMQYYFNQGLLNYNEWLADLYKNTNGHIGFYKQLKESNKTMQELNLKKTNLNTIKTRLEAQVTSYQAIYDAAVENEEKVVKDIMTATKQTTKEKAITKINQLVADGGTEKWQSLLTEYTTCDLAKQQTYPEKVAAENQLQNIIKQIEKIDDDIEDQSEVVQAIEAEFYKKYARYIQEGSWISEDYVDDNLYFLDAENVLYTSAFPQVSYTINVLDLSVLDEYKGYSFNIGDKTYIEDVEFFGYKTNEPVKTPYQEEVVLTEITNYFDEPEKNTITIQNYKTQFEDLFQRITATTQSLQYSNGEYKKSASTINEDGTIKADTLQNSMNNTSLLVSNAANQSVIIGEDGITTTNLSNPLEVVRISSGVIAMSKDAGDTWTTGLSANGISTSSLTTGQIDVSKINIGNSNYPTFSWDENGLTAFAWTETTAENKIVDYYKFVRHDQYGLYGVNGKDGLAWTASSVEDVENNASFGFVWDKFFLKSSTGNGMVKISSNDDIQVIANNTERIKIGVLEEDTEYRIYYGDLQKDKDYYVVNDAGIYEKTTDIIRQEGKTYYTLEDNNLYGIRISDNDENITMETGSDGKLWLKNTLSVGSGDDASQVFIGYNPSNSAIRYIPQKDLESFDPSVDYYEQNDDGTYSKTQDTSVVKGKTYYILSQFHEVIHAGTGNDQFIIYEDGYLIANGGSFTGIINATGGQIGGLQVSEIGELNEKIQMIVGDAKLEFTGDGLIINNGGFQLRNDIYHLYDGDLQEGQDYYIRDNDGRYKKTTDATRREGIIYYTLEKDTPIIYFDPETGDATFSGIIQADGGEFTGVVHAEEGTLGNLSVNGKIEIGDLVLDGTTNTISSKNNNFKISDDGKVVAKDITLGEGELSDYIWVGNNNYSDGGWIFNPTKNNYDVANHNEENIIYSQGDVFVIESEDKKAISLNTKGEMIIHKNGKIIIGQDLEKGITINGGEENSVYIKSNNYLSGSKGWKIEENLAEFNDVTIRGSIKSAVLEYGEIQTVGGVMLIRPSSMIKSIDYGNNAIIVSDADNFKQGDLCIFGSDKMYYRIKSIDRENRKVFFESEDIQVSDSLIEKPLICMMGSTWEEYNDVLQELQDYYVKNDSGIYEKTTDSTRQEGKIYYTLSYKDTIGIGLNSSTNSTFISPTSMSVFESVKSNNQISMDPKIILGKLSTDIVSKFDNTITNDTYGLYADNVYLQGALISRSNNAIAGINTKSKEMWEPNEAEIFGLEDGYPNRIILFAKTLNGQDNAPAFKLDNYGNFYANKGYFKGSIITDSIITAAQIKTAKITGNGTNEKDAGLIIENIANAIDFRDSENSLFKLSSEGISTSLDFKSNNKIQSNEEISITNNDNTVKYLPYLNTTKIGFSDGGWFTYDGSNLNYQQNNDSKIASFGKNVTLNGKIDTTIISPDIKLNTKQMTISQTGSDQSGYAVNYKLTYKYITNKGYDLYVE